MMMMPPLLLRKTTENYNVDRISFVKEDIVYENFEKLWKIRKFAISSTPLFSLPNSRR